MIGELTCINNRFQSNDKVKLSEKEEQLLGTIINSCEYCLDTIKDLQNTVVEKVEEKKKADVDLYKALSYFEEVISECFSLETLWIENKMESHYANMYKINWGTYDKTGDTSGYAKGLSESFLSSAGIMKTTLSANFYLVFVNRIVIFVAGSFLSHLYKNKKANEIAAQQFLVDINDIKKNLATLIQGKGSYEQRVIDNFNNTLNKEVTKIEVRLKVLGYPSDNIEEAYALLIQDQSRDDFDKLLTLKGVKKSDLMNYKLKSKS